MKSISSCKPKSNAFVLAGFLFVVLFLVGPVSAQSPDKEIVIPGDSGLKWVNTGITVVAGDTVRLDAKGEVDVGGSWGIHGPEGTTKFSEQPPGYYPVESKMRYGLAARITLGSGRKYQQTQVWTYGQAKEMRVTRSGILWLTINDDAPDGNTGEFVVQITIVKKKKIIKKH